MEAPGTFSSNKSPQKKLRKREGLEFPSRLSAADTTLLIDLLVSFGDPKDTRRSIKNEDINTELYYVTVHPDIPSHLMGGCVTLGTKLNFETSNCS